MQKLTTIVLIFIGLLIAGLGVFFGSDVIQNIFVQAEDLKPEAVEIKNTTDNSAEIVFTTSKETEPLIEYSITIATNAESGGQNSSSPMLFAQGTKTASHSIKLTLLSANTMYYFRIKIAGREFDNSGVPWTFTTKPAVGQKGKVQSATVVSCLEEVNCQNLLEKIEKKDCNTIDYVKCLKKQK